MYRRLIEEITHQLRAALAYEELSIFVLQLIAWVRLSRLGRLNSELAFDESNKPSKAEKIAVMFKLLSECESLGNNANAFNYVNPAINHFSESQILSVLEILASASIKEAWDKYSFIEYTNERSGRSLVGLPIEVTELITALGQINPDDSVYLPFETNFQLTAYAHKFSNKTFSETQFATSLPWLMNLLCDIDANIAISDSLEKPAFLDEGKLTRYSVSLAMPPFGARCTPSLAEKDRFNRFPETTSVVSVLSLRHMLARTDRRVVIAVPNGLLFTVGVERALRDDLLNKKQIEAVIALPPALLSGVTIPFSLLVLRTDVECNDIVFVDGNNAAFYKKDGRNKATLTGWQSILDTVILRSPSDFSSLVPVKVVIENNSQLQVSRYCKTADDNAVENLLNQYPVKTLGELISIVRPMPISQTDGTELVLEVAPADFPEFGYVNKPGREIKLTLQNAERNRRSYLKPFDIILTIKGSVGKVAIIPNDVPNEKWVMGQSCIVLRQDAKYHSIDPRILFSFLKSEIGQLQIKGIVTGAAVPVIQIRELEKLKIPVPESVDSQSIVSKFEKIADIEESVLQSRQLQEQIAKSIW
jgi:type I restriction enzyme M protein